MTVTPNYLNGTINVDGNNLVYFVEGTGAFVMVIGSAIYYPRTFSGKFKTSFRVAYADLRHFASNDKSVDVENIGLDTYMNDIERVHKEIGFEHYRLLDKSGHTPQLEAPEMFDQVFFEWLKQESGPVALT